MRRYSAQDYGDILRGYLDSKRRLRPADNMWFYMQGWNHGYGMRKENKYQTTINRELIG